MSVNVAARVTLDEIFRPGSIAVVGVSPDMSRFNGGRRFLSSVINPKFKGEIYAVGLQGGEVFGKKIYTSLRDVPGSVDHVISSIPATQVLNLIPDARAKGVKSIHLFTAGLGELGDADAAFLQDRIAGAAAEAGIRLIGPNCMGLYSPSTGVTFDMDFPMVPGNIGLLAQSGSNTELAIMEGGARGLYFSRGISYGNAADVDESEIIEFYTRDPETKVIVAYIEGVKDGPRFRRALTEAASRKPVIVYKGGISEEGARAANSHTGAIAGSRLVWEALLKQAGAVQARNVEELIDLAGLFSYMNRPGGRRVAVIGVGGGASVLAADECAEAGLKLPRFSTELRGRLKSALVTETGMSFKNPVDFFPAVAKQQIQDAFRALTASGEVDLVLLHIPVSFLKINTNDSSIWFKTYLEIKPELGGRTAVVVYHTMTQEATKLGADITRTFGQAGFPMFHSLRSAARALSSFIAYHERKKPA